MTTFINESQSNKVGWISDFLHFRQNGYRLSDLELEKKLLEALIDHTLFEGFSPEQLGTILDHSSHRNLEAGEILIAEGVTNTTLFVLYEGEINIILEEDGVNLVLPVWPGECIGEMSMMLHRKTSAYAVAQSASKVLLIPEDVFWKELVGQRQGVKNLMSIMTTRLRRNNQALMRRMEEQLRFKNLQKELDAAGKIQASMIPHLGLILSGFPEVDVHGLLKQTSQVGGDFYDVLVLDDDHIYLAIGDASGKGMKAALFTIRALTALRMTALNRPFKDLLYTVNEILMRNNEETMFITLFAGVLNIRTGLFRYQNAGHNPTIAALGGQAFQAMKMPEGSVLGITDENTFTIEEKKLEPGDILFMYTDGVTEATRDDGTAYEEARLLNELNAANETTMVELVNCIDHSVKGFCAGAAQFDDLTILAVRYSPCIDN